jgi:hypothetical protein
LVEAGSSAPEAVKVYTMNEAVFLGEDQHIGSVAVGKQADLVLLKGDLDKGANRGCHKLRPDSRSCNSVRGRTEPSSAIDASSESASKPWTDHNPAAGNRSYGSALQDGFAVDGFLIVEIAAPILEHAHVGNACSWVPGESPPIRKLTSNLPKSRLRGDFETKLMRWSACAVKRCLVHCGWKSHPGTGSFRPVAIGAAVEVTKLLKPPM